MTFNNSILLILKEEKSADFNELLAKISSRYKNQTSAYAALSRSLKNLESLGQIKRKNNRIFITDKGQVSIQIEMKEKLVLKLNEALKKPIENIEELVQLLIVFTERANESSDLLQNAREHANFTIEDLSNLQEKIEERQEVLSKMASLIGVQEERLRELNFNDVRSVNFDEKFKEKALAYLGKEKLVIETIDSGLIETLPELWKKENSFVIEEEFTKKAFDILLDFPLSEMVIYLPKIKCEISKGKANCLGSFKQLNSLFKN
jgi:hypothetical protein